MPSLVIEGVECAGKTTLIREFRSRVANWDVVALSHQAGHQFDRFIGAYMALPGVIFNRSHFSERIYAELWNRRPPFTAAEKEVLDSFVERRFVTVLCTADPAALRERYAKRGFAQRASPDELAAIANLFEDEFAGVPHIRYVSSGPEALDDVLEAIERALASACRQNGIAAITTD
jgi:hypothetical protein